MTVGNSDRSPTKHRMQDRYIGRDIGAAPWTGIRYPGMTIIDTNAGNAVGDGENKWPKDSSPMIYSYHASKNKNIRVILYERNKRTFKELIINLNSYLPRLGFNKKREYEWIHTITHSIVIACNLDANTEDFYDLNKNEWVHIGHDPNHAADFCIPTRALYKVATKHPISIFSSVGFNATGIKRLPLKGVRDTWESNNFDSILELINRRYPFDHDMVLALLNNDPAQWTYLCVCPRCWTDSTIKMMKSCGGENLTIFSMCKQLRLFNIAKDRCILTKKEYKEKYS